MNRGQTLCTESCSATHCSHRWMMRKELEQVKCERLCTCRPCGAYNDVAIYPSTGNCLSLIPSLWICGWKVVCSPCQTVMPWISGLLISLTTANLVQCLVATANVLLSLAELEKACLYGSATHIFRMWGSSGRPGRDMHLHMIHSHIHIHLEAW